MKRLRPDGIFPLELWDLEVGDGILWDYMNSPRFGCILKSALIEVWNGTAKTRSEGVIPDIAKHFAGVYLSGGGSAATGDALLGGPWKTVQKGVDQNFAGEAGAMALLSEQGLRGWMLDLGQSTLKVSFNGQRRTWQRDLNRLPIRGGLDTPLVEQRGELRRFLAEAIGECVALSGKLPAAILCGLPSRLDDAGVPEGSSYIGMKGDVTLLIDAFAAAGLHSTQILVLNDAELAAVSARLDPHVHPGTLVLTIGFGIGAALVL